MQPKELSKKKLLIDYQLPTRLEEIVKLAAVVDTTFSEHSDLAFAINLCLDELITNIITHGLNNASDRIIQILIYASDTHLEIILEDDAPAFNPFSQSPHPDFELSLEQRPIGGLGVHFVKNMMDDAHAYYHGTGNHIILLKALPKNYHYK